MASVLQKADGISITYDTAAKAVSRISRELRATVWQVDFGVRNGKPLRLTWARFLTHRDDAQAHCPQSKQPWDNSLFHI